MENNNIPRQGEIYQHFKDKLYQIVAIATHSETRETMVVYQALYGDFKTYVRPLDMFMSEVDKEKYPDAKQKRRFELREEIGKPIIEMKHESQLEHELQVEHAQQQHADVSASAAPTDDIPAEKVNHILLEFLEAESYHRKLDVISSNMKHMNDRLINDMAVSLDCTVEEGPLEKRVQELLYCLKAMSRFEDRRLR